MNNERENVHPNNLATLKIRNTILPFHQRDICQRSPLLCNNFQISFLPQSFLEGPDHLAVLSGSFHKTEYILVCLNCFCLLSSVEFCCISFYLLLLYAAWSCIWELDGHVNPMNISIQYMLTLSSD